MLQAVTDANVASSPARRVGTGTNGRVRMDMKVKIDPNARLIGVYTGDGRSPLNPSNPHYPYHWYLNDFPLTTPPPVTP